jgi:hypothetical protein
MGQKAVVVTLRSYRYNNISYNPYVFTNNLNFLAFFEKLLFSKGVIVVDKCISYDNNTYLLKLKLFYKSHLLSQYITKRNSKVFTEYGTAFIIKLLKDYQKKFNITNININLQILNSQVNLSILNFLYLELNKYVSTIFTRRFNLFIDFIKIYSLFCEKKVSGDSFCTILGYIFKSLSKKFHTRFILFIKHSIKIMLGKNIKSVKLKGIKLIISGRLLGKPRASSILINEGCIPNQSLNKYVSFSKKHVYTIYGAFGLKAWIFFS